MREILFRGKRTDNGEWLYGDLRHIEWHGGFVLSIIIEPDNGYNNNVCGYPIFSKTAGQYTGLTDKNGKEIFEGDIVMDNYKRILEVVFKNYKYQFRAITETNFMFADIFDWENWCEVIGNIHDNPELLEG